MHDCQLAKILIERHQDTSFFMSARKDFVIAGVSRPIVRRSNHVVPGFLKRLTRAAPNNKSNKILICSLHKLVLY